MGTIHTVGPYEAIIVSGSWGSKREKKIVIGGWVWVWCLVSNVSYLPLALLTVYPQCQQVETSMGVALNVSAVAHVKIKRSLVEIAAEQFAGKKMKEIKMTIGATMEGHLRAILGTLTVEEVLRDRLKFSYKVRTVAEDDLARMGMQIISFTILDIVDNVGYLKSLGKSQIAEVKRAADIAIAENNKIAGIREAECEKEAMDIIYKTETQIENNKSLSQMKISEFNAEIRAAKAQTDLAFPLQEAIIRQKIREQEMEIDIMEYRKKIEIEELEVRRKDVELIATVKLPVEAESYWLEQIAQGEKTKILEESKAEYTTIQKIGEAEAEVIKNIGTATAESNRLKANAFKLYNKAATMSLVLEAMPEITAEVVSPLSNINEIVILSGNDKTTSEVTRLVSQMPPVLNAVGAPSILEKVMKKTFSKTKIE